MNKTTFHICNELKKGATRDLQMTSMLCVVCLLFSKRCITEIILQRELELQQFQQQLLYQQQLCQQQHQQLLLLLLLRELLLLQQLLCQYFK